jgi:hypothetical protein
MDRTVLYVDPYFLPLTAYWQKACPRLRTTTLSSCCFVSDDHGDDLRRFSHVCVFVSLAILDNIVWTFYCMRLQETDADGLTRRDHGHEDACAREVADRLHQHHISTKVFVPLFTTVPPVHSHTYCLLAYSSACSLLLLFVVSLS